MMSAPAFFFISTFFFLCACVCNLPTFCFRFNYAITLIMTSDGIQSGFNSALRCRRRDGGTAAGATHGCVSLPPNAADAGFDCLNMTRTWVRDSSFFSVSVELYGQLKEQCLYRMDSK